MWIISRSNNRLSRIYYYCTMVASIPLTNVHGSDTTTTTNATTSQVPFFYVPSKTEETMDPPFRELKRAMEDYRSIVAKLLHQLERAALLSQESERVFTTSSTTKLESPSSSSMASQMQEKRARLATILELDGFTIEKMIRPFTLVVVAPTTTIPPQQQQQQQQQQNEKQKDMHSHDCESEEEKVSIGIPDVDKTKAPACDTTTSTKWVLKSRKRTNYYSNKNHNTNNDLPDSAYSSAISVKTHLTRDWTDLGNAIRQMHYGWLIRELISHVETKNNSTQNGKQRRILVPGAGLGRLAHEIASVGYSVEANDCSIVMAAVANQILNTNADASTTTTTATLSKNDNITTTTKPITFYPFATDPFVNEVNSLLRYKEVSIRWNDAPLIQQQQQHPQGMILSYTVGDFVSIYSSPTQQSVFDSIVTCFFLDTATNIYEYIATIRNALQPNGIWLNLGPVQWHENALLRPTVDELRILIQDIFHFRILFWQVDAEAVNYRSSTSNKDVGDDALYSTSSSTSSTVFDGYRPLRFIAIAPSSSSSAKDQQPVESTLDCIETLRSTFDRMSHIVE